MYAGDRDPAGIRAPRIAKRLLKVIPRAQCADQRINITNYDVTPMVSL